MKNTVLLFMCVVILIAGGCLAKRTSAPYSARTPEMILETLCDSIYPGKGYKVVIQYFPEGVVDSLDYNNIVFQLFAKEKLICQDTLFSSYGAVEFGDFSGDNVKDILIRHYADVRSNLHYYLYIVDMSNDKIKKIKGFEEIKNPHYLPEHNLIDNYVMSGRNWTNFYEIRNDTVRDFDMVIHAYFEDDPEYECGYDTEYKKTIEKILQLRNTENETIE